MVKSAVFSLGGAGNLHRHTDFVKASVAASAWRQWSEVTWRNWPDHEYFPQIPSAQPFC